MRVKGTVGQAGITTGTTLKTLLQVIAASNHRVTVTNVSISFNGVTNTDAPILVEILRQTTAGTMTSATPVKLNNADDETLQTTAQHTATVEPTPGDVLWRGYVHPQSGVILPHEFIVPGGTRLGLRVTAGVSVSANVQMDFEE